MSAKKQEPPPLMFTCRELSDRMGGSWSARRIRRWLMKRGLGGMQGHVYTVTMQEIVLREPKIGAALAARMAERDGGVTNSRIENLERRVSCLHDEIRNIRKTLTNRLRRRRKNDAPMAAE